MKLEHIKNLIQSCNLNFLIGSGVSNPYLSTLGNIEIILSELDQQKSDSLEKSILKASLFKKYFDDVIYGNLNIIVNKYKAAYQEKNEDELEDDKYMQYLEVFNSYKNLLLNINEILLFRHNNLLTKQVNLFTTNIDLFLEKSLDQTNLEFNDGFKGRLKPTYDLSNFQKSYSKTSSHYDNISEIPVFNLYKIHGSINWGLNDAKKIIHNNSNSQIISIKSELKKIPAEMFLEFSGNETFEELLDQAAKIEIEDESIYDKFFEEFNRLVIINPTKEKFKRTVIDEEFYELLRIYANSLEKENTLLLVLGFSFADEHIRNITIRAANSNPTLQVVIFVYTDGEKENLLMKLQSIRNNNVAFLTPQSFIEANKENDDKKLPKKQKLNVRLKNFNLKTINDEIFEEINSMIRYRNLSK